MHSDATQFDLVAPDTLAHTLALLSEGRHTPIAGGTELMVAFGAGRLVPRSLLSIHHLRELRFIRVTDDAIHIGSCTTFTDIRRSVDIARELPLLTQAASWTGSIANQNRATLGGNICNASPAADTPPALLCYDAAVRLINVDGARELPYAEFHLGYKKTALRPDELLHSVIVPRTFGGHRQYIRKVGTRNAQAISKVALAAVARLEDGRLAEVRLGAASLTDRPTRCMVTEAALLGQRVTDETIAAARAALAAETHAIDDIRSTAQYRAHVAGNLLEEFLRSLLL